MEPLASETTTRVLLVGPSFSNGGAERRFSNIATYLFEGKADVAVLAPGRGLETRIVGEVFCLGWSGRLSHFRAAWILRQRLKNKRYSVVMAFGLFPCVVSILANLFLGPETKLIVSEITRPKMEALESKGWRTWLYNFLRKFLYRRSDLITANSIDGLRETCELAGVPVEQGVRVVNVVDGFRLLGQSMSDIDTPLPDGRYVICVGRLDFMKRIDTVVSAFGLLADHLECKLVIVGDGMARQSLEHQVETLGLRNSVIFTGALENPFPLLKGASGFVLASEYEGFSNSVLEAMFSDVPVITSLCSSDALEMCVQEAVLGFKVGDVDQLAEHLKTVITDGQLSQALVSCARTYRLPHVLERAIPFYENLILRVTGQELAEHEGLRP